MRHGEPKEPLLGMRMPPPILGPDYEGQAGALVDGLDDGVLRQPLDATGVTAIIGKE